MQQGKPITIRPVRNGFIVTEMYKQDQFTMDCETKVFETTENLIAFIREHFPEE